MLIWKVKKDDRSALRQIYEKYRTDPLRIAAGLLIEPSAAEDAVHDVFTAFIQSLDLFTLTGSFRGFLTTCVANRARNLNRSKARHSQAQQTIFLDEFEFDFQLDPAAFSTQVKGYEVETLILDYRPAESVEPNEITSSQMQNELAHTAYTIDNLPWIQKQLFFVFLGSKFIKIGE